MRKQTIKINKRVGVFNFEKAEWREASLVITVSIYYLWFFKTGDINIRIDCHVGGTGQKYVVQTTAKQLDAVASFANVNSLYASIGCCFLIQRELLRPLVTEILEQIKEEKSFLRSIRWE